jgi:hypothetical protein
VAYGLRFDDAVMSVGDVLPRSRVWVDGEPTSSLLPGTCCLLLAASSADAAAQEATALLGSKLARGYLGTPYVIGGERVAYGEDYGEAILRPAVVVAVLPWFRTPKERRGVRMTRRRNPDEETPPEAPELDLHDCERCDESVETTQAVVVNDRGREQEWCPPCVTEQASTCESCRTLTDQDVMEVVEDEHYCSNCASGVPLCERCEERHHDASMVHTDSYGRSRNDQVWCESCQDGNSWTCAECNDRFANDASSYTVDGDQEWCMGCLENNASYCEECDEYSSEPHDHDSGDDSGDEDGIGDYHSTDFKPIDSPWVRYQPQRIFFGVELEVEVPGGEARGPFAENVRDSMGELLAGLENDGSLTHGFEIITHPAGLDTHRKHWAKANLQGLISHDTKTCGLHIHVTRAAMTKYTIGKIVEFSNSEKNAAFMETLARRSFTGYAKRVADMTIVKSTKRRPERYEAWNLTNTDTIEFRLPKGTTKQTTIIATLEFVFALIRFCEHASAQQLTTENFKKFIARDEWHYDTVLLRPYLVERGLATAAEMRLPKRKIGPVQEDAPAVRTNPHREPSYTEAALLEYLQEGEPDWGA